MERKCSVAEALAELSVSELAKKEDAEESRKTQSSKAGENVRELCTIVEQTNLQKSESVTSVELLNQLNTIVAKSRCIGATGLPKPAGTFSPADLGVSHFHPGNTPAMSAVASYPESPSLTDGAFSLTSDSQKFNGPFRELTLLQLGFKQKKTRILMEKPSLSIYLMHMFCNGIDTDIRIRIGPVVFNCHLMLLGIYTNFFRHMENEVILSPQAITPCGFVRAYKWMLDRQGQLNRKGFAELLQAAEHLKMEALLNNIWSVLSSEKPFNEAEAFKLYLEACALRLEELKHLMLSRVRLYFLTLVSQQRFLDLPLDEVCAVLSSNTLGVNTEIEVLMSAIRWLEYDWEKREQHVGRVMRCVRFGLMSPFYLPTLTVPNECPTLNRMLSYPEVQKYVQEGITFKMTQASCGDNQQQFLNYLAAHKLNAPLQRQWIFDKACKYHHRRDCGNLTFFNYKQFVSYLNLITTKDKKYWRTLRTKKTISPDIVCCDAPTLPASDLQKFKK